MCRTGGERSAYEVACAELLGDAGADPNRAAQIWTPIGLVNPQ